MYSFTSRVRYSEIDESGALSITSLIDYLQDCSTFHSDSLGLGLDHSAETGYAWLLSAWEIEIRALPHFGDEIRVSTWATDFKGLRAGRNFTICAADDGEGTNPLVRADSSWFMFDANAGRPIRAPKEEVRPYLEDCRDDTPLDMPPVPHVLRAEGEGTPAAPVVVTAGHLDTNHHVNNAQYVAMALGALSESKETATTAAQIRGLDVHYSRAAKLGDTVFPHIHQGEAAAVLTVTLDGEDGKPYATVRVRK